MTASGKAVGTRILNWILVAADGRRSAHRDQRGRNGTYSMLMAQGLRPQVSRSRVTAAKDVLRG